MQSISDVITRRKMGTMCSLALPAQCGNMRLHWSFIGFHRERCRHLVVAVDTCHGSCSLVFYPPCDTLAHLGRTKWYYLQKWEAVSSQCGFSSLRRFDYLGRTIFFKASMVPGLRQCGSFLHACISDLSPEDPWIFLIPKTLYWASIYFQAGNLFPP